MFGIIRPCRHRLGGELAAAWTAQLCGLCLALRDRAHRNRRRRGVRSHRRVGGRPDNGVPLREVGRLFGRVAHLLDAVEDYHDDMARGKWNPLAATATPVAAARALCDDAVLGIELALADVSFTDGRLVDRLLTSEVRRAIKRTFTRAGYPGGGEDPNPARRARASRSRSTSATSRPSPRTTAKPPTQSANRAETAPAAGAVARAATAAATTAAATALDAPVAASPRGPEPSAIT